MSNFVELVDLASELLEGAALAASDELFAASENLLEAEPPPWVAGKYTDRGTWMGERETRRRRGPDHDWVIIRLRLPDVVRGMVVDTHEFRGAYPESCAIDACALVDIPAFGADAVPAEQVKWRERLPRSAQVTRLRLGKLRLPQPGRNLSCGRDR